MNNKTQNKQRTTQNKTYKSSDGRTLTYESIRQIRINRLIEINHLYKRKNLEKLNLDQLNDLIRQHCLDGSLD